MTMPALRQRARLFAQSDVSPYYITDYKYEWKPTCPAGQRVLRWTIAFRNSQDAKRVSPCDHGSSGGKTDLAGRSGAGVLPIEDMGFREREVERLDVEREGSKALRRCRRHRYTGKEDDGE